jgi:hypothetical protein
MPASCSQENVFGAVRRVSQQGLAASESQEAEDTAHDPHLVHFRKEPEYSVLRCIVLEDHNKPQEWDINTLTTCRPHTWLTD